ncbi:hypothetical protein A2334_02575 [Candidatus Roizmanbacteria bacterium RIFOXYB2_FULL_38_10]|uniref:Uncharacterized protein n=1 Tax=Candidatus Roizmanbacteria bacterium RIFOXYD1_FULL_38_12 TaxID=1802093 RepID=A0A1F7KZX1_9BACT|nr:MAG: hypothetical protein A3K47_01395 [Candidatus Roizmanbacteria bacterium RIFOXYA2_FULL_38_14]OGK63439.1 MAG: hypothetical protein A3K27_01395 [Candidatus Roizmanbacteria bacterium RIFOXYA1_FULL_37_12]OGK65285.1 MAG: hypothetical protein A3K38_01395 [Candidatus Roizmanbacteria bacterium RIFOXYB1_FULL_40_23]OGK68001.1 MAG: hypothetical protein A2334_02575 [Candidatus Roizmanbacteria bacterium RIFOXYB2_FULL_38_10]OGK69690.1 MAG: hypothetical protein A3K21_01400 [Candidatus Roizmanbacteria ba
MATHPEAKNNLIRRLESITEKSIPQDILPTVEQHIGYLGLTLAVILFQRPFFPSAEYEIEIPLINRRTLAISLNDASELYSLVLSLENAIGLIKPKLQEVIRVSYSLDNPETYGRTLKQVASFLSFKTSTEYIRQLRNQGERSLRRSQILIYKFKK